MNNTKKNNDEYMFQYLQNTYSQAFQIRLHERHMFTKISYIYKTSS